MTASVDVRARLIDTLRLDLVGPSHDDPSYAEELLPEAPSKWYLTGFLVPYEAPLAQRVDEFVDDEADETDEKVRPSDDAQAPERASARKALFPSSLGLSVLAPAGTEELLVRVRWADYYTLADESEDLAPAKGSNPEEAGAAQRARWRRVPRSAECVVPVGGTSKPHPLPEGGGLELVVSARPAGELLPAGTRSVSVFLVNNRPPAADVRRDLAYVFQVELALELPAGFTPRPNKRGLGRGDDDERVADLQYRDAFEFVVGHNVSAVAEVTPEGLCKRVHSAWIPRGEVHKVDPTQLPGVELGMEALGACASAEAVRDCLGPLVSQYAEWIARQRGVAGDLEGSRSLVAIQLVERAERARRRIDAGLRALEDPLALEAFRLTNRAIATALRQRATHDQPGTKPGDVEAPAWRPFQLAFLLMNLPGVIDPGHGDREVVDLLFFPTGGGKTEAYLGLAAFTILLRRLRDPSVQSAGLAVLMRYTLRLLTLDQLGRAATLICALELLRQGDSPRLGEWPLEIGLWVGQSATPNRMGQKGDDDEHSARTKTRRFQRDDKRNPSPIPLERCPWCGTKFNKNCFQLLPSDEAPSDLRVTCARRACAFHSRRQRQGLPILSVDEPIYRRLPAFIIATVDKFANMPWVGQTGALFGRVERHDGDGFYGPCQPGRGRPLAGPLSGPELIIQDELHLISGPLGTMVGLYETALDALAGPDPGAPLGRPKIVASTATVRRARKQIRALFGRGEVDVFPPPGPDRRDSFFAHTVSPDEKPARVYLGVAAQGRNLKVVFLRTCLALLAAGQKTWEEAEAEGLAPNPADPYMTVISYFNSLRELGGSRRIVEDEVRDKLTTYAEVRRRSGEEVGAFANRPHFEEPHELTSRVPTHTVADTKRRLALSFEAKERVDVALATNMISVGLDITRLGLMVVLGQPKTAAEYIQTTSRVGRDPKRPGLVVTLLNVHRPRDRSHYERFPAWHESFYRAVEATSVTPFSPRALDRGLAGVTVALARLGLPSLTAPRGALEVGKHLSALEFVRELVSRRAEAHDKDLGKAEAEALRQRVRGRVSDLLDEWAHIAQKRGDLQYQREVGVSPPLLFRPLDPELESNPDYKFKAGRSLRDVEPTVNLWLRKPDPLGTGG